MELKEIKRNLFELDERYALAHCVSLDCAMGAGIAVDFDKRYKGMKSDLKTVIVDNKIDYPITLYHGVHNVFNLFTKKKYWHKPTYESITQCIKEMKDLVIINGIKYLAMPKIGCGLDRLQWSKVKEIIIEKFKDLDIEIVVCYL